jgi:predicted Zn finger-like uncharacterized protein
MILNCPNCGAKFKVNAALLGETGRSVRCGNCAHSWHQAPPVPETVEDGPPDAAAEWDGDSPSAAVPEPAEEVAPETAEAWGDESPPTSTPEPAEDIAPDTTAASSGASRPARPDSLDKLDEQRRRRQRGPAAPPEKKSSQVLGWTLLTLFLLALAGGLVVAREKIIALAPGTAAYYERLGLQAMIGDGLDLRDVTSERRSVDGESQLIVRGTVVNVSGRVRTVPRLRASLIDANGTELADWTFRADSSELQPGGSTVFETVTNDPPDEGNLRLVFVE